MLHKAQITEGGSRRGERGEEKAGNKTGQYRCSEKKKENWRAGKSERESPLGVVTVTWEHAYRRIDLNS